jgi:hypothetical protein
MRVRVIGILAATLLLAGCSRSGKKPADDLYGYEVDKAFVARALGDGYQLVGGASVDDFDTRPGHEAVFVVRPRKGGRHELVMARGNREVIARAPFAGKPLDSGTIPVAPVTLDLWKDKQSTGFLLPVQFEGQVCHGLALRYVRTTRQLTLAGTFRVPCDPPDKGTTSVLDHPPCTRCPGPLSPAGTSSRCSSSSVATGEVRKVSRPILLAATFITIRYDPPVPRGQTWGQQDLREFVTPTGAPRCR